MMHETKREQKTQNVQKQSLSSLTENLIASLNSVLVSKKIELKNFNVHEGTDMFYFTNNWESVFFDLIKNLLFNVICEGISVNVYNQRIVFNFENWNGSREFLDNSNIPSMLKYIEISHSNKIKVSMKEIQSTNLSLQVGIKIE